MNAVDSVNAHLILASRFENIEVAERALHDLCATAGCDGDQLYWVVTALREALANAVRHGNHLLPERKVHVDLSVDAEAVTIRVEDEGEGFDPSQIPDPTVPENLLRPSGRGIFYMQQFMNRVQFSRAPGGGTSVLMVKLLQPTTRSAENEKPNPRSR
ncbi:MAG TPA: ATP-binding protein [Thermoanaerobaculales bacterium]|nr:ATP-binding protein [Thermoanaerobaculales bacterium]HPA80687.1 ATP-binding protein [Thermoanaerobaculales bacterium]HQL28830.1 ATP-binding protein [Thermoanaerobaculales bacterium]HQN97583.1 ATP-binding protein [Thermoanaerobaculales bacterium]HQP42256.1 ATP-binding protein [Thermoanaerobaculales bacterium]